MADGSDDQGRVTVKLDELEALCLALAAKRHQHDRDLVDFRLSPQVRLLSWRGEMTEMLAVWNEFLSEAVNAPPRPDDPVRELASIHVRSDGTVVVRGPAGKFPPITYEQT